MASRSHLRLLAIPVFAGAALLGTASAANAAEVVQPVADVSNVGDVGKYSEAGLRSVMAASAVEKGQVQSAAHHAVLRACVGDDAITNIKYTVDGKQVSNLQGQTKEGSIVKVDFKLAKGCKDTEVGLAVYKAQEPVWNPATADKQVLVAKDHRLVSAKDGHVSLQVQVTDCNYQVDFFTGPVLENLSATKNYSSPENNLISYDNGGTKTCDTPVVTPPPVDTPPPVVTPPVTPPPVVTPPVVTPPVVTPPVVTPPAETTDKSCPVNAFDRITNITYTINGVPGFLDLSTVKPGDRVMVTFTLDEDCEEAVYSLVTYNAIDDEFTRDNAAFQTLFDAATGTFGPGTHSLEVVVPDCYFQIDFVMGLPIEKFGPSDSSNFYADQDRLIEAGVGGDECEVPEPPVEVPEPEVLEEVITPEPQLAVTGLNSVDLLLLGSALTLMGGALNRASSRSRRSEGAHFA